MRASKPEERHEPRDQYPRAYRRWGIRSIPTFNAEAFGAKYGGVTMATLRPGAVLFRQGETTDSLFYVQAGQIQITVLSSQGKSGILGILDSGNFCGEGSLLATGRGWRQPPV